MELKDRLTKVFDYDGFELFIGRVPVKTDKGGSWLAYELHVDGELIFSGNDYSPSPMQKLDVKSLEIVSGLLGFLSLQEGDTDDEYFEDYTEKQMEFAQSYRCEVLSYYVCDMEDCQTWDEFWDMYSADNPED